MMNETGIVVGLEHINELYLLGVKNISKNNSKLLNSRNIICVEGDGRYGYNQLGPYDVIHVGAGKSS
jgi:protein-L-isoaspartate(D-aspartate) O-methyltransferase